MGGQICSSDLKVLPTVVDKNNGVGAESGNDFHFPDIALDPVHFRSIFVRFPSVASDRVDILQIGNKTCFSRISEKQLLKFAFLIGFLHAAWISKIRPSRNWSEKRSKSFPLSLGGGGNEGFALFKKYIKIQNSL